MLIGQGGEGLLSEEEIRKIISDGFSAADLAGKKIIVIIPDNTRSGPMPAVFRALADALLPSVSRLDFLIALGTHQPMSEESIRDYLELEPADLSGKYKSVNIFNHEWNSPGTFKTIGSIPASEIEKISNGLMSEEVEVSINKLIFDYDAAIIYGPVFPHEVAGFSGGHKYLFPGIAGAEIINFTHWLGALITNYEIIGRMDTPVRAVIERAAEMVGLPIVGACSVIEGEDGMAGLFVGPVKEAWRAASRLSSSLHIKWTPYHFRQVISVMPEMYDDLWVGAKGMYKMEPVVRDGGEVIIYAPHIREISFTHGEVIEEIGYHVRDYFLKQWDRFKHYPGGVLAHSTHVKGQGVFENGVEKPRVKVTLATGIPREKCEKVNLGYRDPGKINPADFAGKEHEGVLVVWRAGETLYRLDSEKPREASGG